jgi:hypothetical protein
MGMGMGFVGLWVQKPMEYRLMGFAPRKVAGMTFS